MKINLYQNNIPYLLNSFNPGENLSLNPFGQYGNNIFDKKSNNLEKNISSKFYLENPFLNDSININNNENEELNKSQEDKSLLFFRSHNFTNDKDIIKIEQKIKEEKEFYEKLSNNLEEEMKCCICLNKYKDPLLSPCCHHLFCKKCLSKWYSGSKNNCVFCRKNIDFKSYIEISSFRDILSFLELLKDKNKDYFTQIENNNLNNSIILCSNKIHEINEKKEDNDSNDNEKYIDKLNEIKADYYCLDCNKPYCSDCICLFNDYIYCEHKNEHCITSIEILKEMKLFDLLYEKENNKSLEKLEKINENVKKGIDNLTKNKNSILLFIDYIKNIYIKFIEDNINTLNNILKNNEIEISKIKEKLKDIDLFINNLKKEKSINNFKNMQIIQNNRDILSNFDKLPDSIKNELTNILQFSGNIQIKEHMNKSFKFDKKHFETVDALTFDLEYKISLIIVNENYQKNNNYDNPFIIGYNEVNNSSESNNIDNNSISKSNKIKLIIKFDKFNLFLKNKFFLPILFNNKNEFLVFEEIKDTEDKYLIKEKEKNNENINSIFYGTMSFTPKNQRYFRIYVDMDKLIDNNNIEINNNNIFDEKNEIIKISLFSLIIS